MPQCAILVLDRSAAAAYDAMSRNPNQTLRVWRPLQMALVNKAWREGTYVPPGATPGLTNGREYVENVQNSAVQDIARTRFVYPSAAQPELKTYVNRPEHTIGVRSAAGDLLFPDIVVLNTSTTEVYLLAEVETDRSLHEPDVADKWRAFAGVGSLYLFVPFSRRKRAREQLRAAGVKLLGLRAWWYNQGLKEIQILEL
jgi:hypothetical protein